MSDHESEKKWGFNLRTTLRNSAKSPLLSDYKVFATKSVVPPPSQLKGTKYTSWLLFVSLIEISIADIVQFAGGQWLKSMPKAANEKTVLISCAEDKKLIGPAIKSKITVCDKELLLTGLLKKELDFKTHKLKL